MNDSYEAGSWYIWYVPSYSMVHSIAIENVPYTVPCMVEITGTYASRYMFSMHLLVEASSLKVLKWTYCDSGKPLLTSPTLEPGVVWCTVYTLMYLLNTCYVTRAPMVCTPWEFTTTVPRECTATVRVYHQCDAPYSNVPTVKKISMVQLMCFTHHKAPTLFGGTPWGLIPSPRRKGESIQDQPLLKRT